MTGTCSDLLEDNHMAITSVEETGSVNTTAPLGISAERVTVRHRQPWLVPKPCDGSEGFSTEQARQLTESVVNAVDQSTIDSARDPETIAIFAQVMKRWKLQDHEAAALLGVDLKEWHQLQASAQHFQDSQAPSGDNHPSLSNEQLERVGIVVHMLITLRRLLKEETANRWVRMRNTNPVFGGATPIEVMVEGGLPKMRAARDYLDAALR